MQPLQAAIWGALGAIAIEAYDLFVVLRSNHRWPGRNTDVSLASAFGVWVASALARVVVGALTAAAASSQLSGAFGAFGVGVAGTIVLERILATAKTGIPEAKPHPGPPLPPAASVVGQATDAT